MLLNPRVKRGQLPFFLSLLVLVTISNLSLCLQWLNNSCLLLSVAFSGLYMMCHFLLVHRLHTPVVDEKGAARQTTSQFTSGSSLLSCRFQICPASVDFVLLPGLLKSTIPLLEGVGRKADILFLPAGSLGSTRGPVYEALHCALAWEGTFGFVVAVACWWGVMFFLV